MALTLVLGLVPDEFSQVTAVLVLVLVALLGSFALDIVSTVLNLSTLDQPLPLEFEGTYDKEAYVKSQAYTRAKAVVHLAHSTFDLGLLLTFWFGLHGFQWLDVVVRSAVPGESPWVVVPRGLLYWSLLVGGATIMDMPWELYHTFVTEERFGFNKTTLKTFVVDRLKGLGLALLLGPPVGGAVLAFFAMAGSLGWLYVWAFVAVFQALLLFVAPVLIFPLFHKYTPLPEGETRDAISQYAARVGFTFGDVFQIDGSTRSSHSNAFFTGFGSTKRIALFDTLVEQVAMPQQRDCPHEARPPHEIARTSRGAHHRTTTLARHCLPRPRPVLPSAAVTSRRFLPTR